VCRPRMERRYCRGVNKLVRDQHMGLEGKAAAAPEHTSVHKVSTDISNASLGCRVELKKKHSYCSSATVHHSTSP
jgi:hypothetical protein